MIASVSGLGWLALGAVLAGGYLAVGFRFTGRRARAWWATGLLVAALLHVGFAIGDGAGAVLLQLVGVAGAGVFARLGLSGRPGWLAAGWLLHPVWDLALGGTSPAWYVWTCLSFDLVVGAALYVRAVRR
ncbi:hypothetical protein [Rubrivirga sp. IMCC45206]|uniref:hypothetical protein n=1 Tax=Rubrivirga sp. IMCC45206 TaxID=3391614 RepID=UPI00398FCE9A